MRALLAISVLALTSSALATESGLPAEPASDAGSPEPSATPASSSAPAPYGAWQGQNYRPPPGEVAPPAPAPVVGSPEYARRTVELIPALGFALPSCHAGTRSDDRCDGVKTGGVAGFTGLWRVTPYFAWGGGFEVAGFQYTPPPEVDLKDAGAGAIWLGLVGRVYFNDEGSLDPYVQLGVGVSALGTTGTDSTGTDWEETGAGPAVQLGGGLDFYLSRSLRLGPSLAYTRVFVDKIRRCRAGGDGDCVDVSKDEDGYLSSYFTLTARLTILLGGEH